MPEKDKLEQMISDWVDDELEPDMQTEVEKILAADPAAWKQATELKQMKSTMSEPVPPISEDLYIKLQKKIDKKYGRTARFWFTFRNPGFKLGLACGLVLLVMWVGRPTIEKQNEAAIPDQIESPHEFNAELADMEKLTKQKLMQLPKEVSFVYYQNLKIINQALAKCRAISRRNPGSHNAHDSWKMAYEAKINLMAQILRT